MEFRKIIAFGKSSFVVSMPKDWLNANKLVKGDVVFLEQDDEKLIITSKEKEEEHEEKRAVIKIDGKDLKRIKREIHSAYINSYDYIVVEGKNVLKYTKEIDEYIHNLIALEVLEKDANKIVARDYLKLSDVHIKEHLKKCDIVLRSMFTDLVDPNFKDYKELYERGDYANRLYFLILKVVKTTFDDLTLLKKIHLSSPELLEVYTINSFLRTTLRNIKTLITNVSTIDKKRRLEVLKVIKMVFEYYLEVMKVSSSKDVEKAYAVANRRDEVIEIINKSMNNTKQEVIIAQHLIAISRSLHHIVRRIFDGFF